MSDSDPGNNGWSLAGFFKPAASHLRGAIPPRRPPKQLSRRTAANHDYDAIEPPQVQDFTFHGSYQYSPPSAESGVENPPRVTSFQFQGSPAPTPSENAYVPVVARPPPTLPAVPETQVIEATPLQQENTPAAPSMYDVSDEEDGDADEQADMPAPLAPRLPPQIPQIPSHGRIHLDLITSPNSNNNLDIMPPVDVDRLQIHTPSTRTGEFEERSSSPLPEVLQTYFPEKDGADPLNPNTTVVQPGTQTEPHRPTAMEETRREAEHVKTKPTCSLNLVCYRAQSASCELYQLRTAKKSRFKDDYSYEKALAADPELIVTDAMFFEKLREAYKYEMCSFWRRVFFLKTLRGLRLLSYTANSRPTVVQLDNFVLQEMFYAYKHPSRIDTDYIWIDWVFRLRQPDKRHALEFVEGWNRTRIGIAGMLPLIFSTLVGLTWSIRSGDWQTAFTVAGFILTAGTLLLALLAVISGIETSGKTVT